MMTMGNSLQRDAGQTIPKLFTASSLHANPWLPSVSLPPFSNPSMDMIWSCSYWWSNFYVFSTLKRLEKRGSQLGSRTYNQGSLEIRDRGKACRDPLLKPCHFLFHLGKLTCTEVRDFSRSHFMRLQGWTWYPVFQPVSLVFFSLQSINVLKQLPTKKNSKIKIKHLQNKVNQWNLICTNLICTPFVSIFTYSINQGQPTTITLCLMLIRCQGSCHNK